VSEQEEIRRLLAEYCLATDTGKPPHAWLDSGYMVQADTIEGLAAACGIDRKGLQNTVARFNRFCAEGRDL
jgi:3-oxosteroid 1-dehydrogenase